MRCAAIVAPLNQIRIISRVEKNLRFVLDFLNICVSRYRLLESRLEETVQQTMKIKEEKISCLEKKVEESSTLNAALRAELATVRTCIKNPSLSPLSGRSVLLMIKTINVGKR